MIDRFLLVATETIDLGRLPSQAMIVALALLFAALLTVSVMPFTPEPTQPAGREADHGN